MKTETNQETKDFLLSIIPLLIGEVDTQQVPIPPELIGNEKEISFLKNSIRSKIVNRTRRSPNVKSVSVKDVGESIVIKIEMRDNLSYEDAKRLLIADKLSFRDKKKMEKYKEYNSRCHRAVKKDIISKLLDLF